MGSRITVWTNCLVAFIVWCGLAYAQPPKMIRLPNGIEVYDLSGEWDAQIENNHRATSYGINLDAVKISIAGSFCPLTGQITSPIRIIGVKLISNTPSQESGQPGREVFRGELEGNTFEKLEIISDGGETITCKGQIRDNGNIIIIEAPGLGRITLTKK